MARWHQIKWPITPRKLFSQHFEFKYEDSSGFSHGSIPIIKCGGLVAIISTIYQAHLLLKWFNRDLDSNCSSYFYAGVFTHEKKKWPPWLLTVSSRWAHRELMVTKMVTASRDWAMTWAVIELWPSRDWAVIILKMPWLSCDLAVTELWPLLAVTEPWSLGRGAVTTVVTVSSPWPFIFSSVPIHALTSTMV